MTPPLTLQPNCPMETPTEAETLSTQLLGLAPILWWALPSGLAVFLPELTNASTYAWLPGSWPLLSRGVDFAVSAVFTLLTATPEHRIEGMIELIF
ncbi:hypothetical protein DSO57_1007166 [Entomophthora muscae]|uniref:Uncharacterized protein n=1 Tax=Entomophthora muscae TaxID=34485 RepID=A0ACC2U6T5_9FUNG|nr:hypothetical protein DSO57_1007166 [Entomophthora muscae]